MNYARPLHLAAIALTLTTGLLLASCSSVTVTDVWTAPNLTNLSFKKITVIAATRDVAKRHQAEDALGAAMPNVLVIPSYALIPDDAQMKDIPVIEQTLKAAAIDGVVVFRLISNRSEISVTQNPGFPMGYGTFGGYYGNYCMTSMYAPVVSVTHIISIETNIYEATNGKLLWSAVTTNNSPSDITETLDAAVTAIRAQLVKQKLIPEIKS